MSEPTRQPANGPSEEDQGRGGQGSAPARYTAPAYLRRYLRRLPATS